MNILLTFNDAYAPHAAAVISGLLSHCSQSLVIYVLYLDLGDVTINKMLDYYKDRVNLKFIKVDIPNEFVHNIEEIEKKKTGPLKGKLDVYLRLFAPLYILEDDVVYLDCDIVINGDVSKMMDEIDKSKFLSAVKEHDPLHKMNHFSQINSLPMPYSLSYYVMRDAFFFRMKKKHSMRYTSSYFCAGIMYMNLKTMREEDFFGKVVQKMKGTSNWVFADQDILNSIVDGDFGVLSPKWNSFVVGQGILTNYSLEELKEASANPIIVHMPGIGKPWNKELGGKYRKMYWEYRMDTPWPDRFTYPLSRKIADKICGLYNNGIIRFASLILSLKLGKFVPQQEILDSYCE